MSGKREAPQRDVAAVRAERAQRARAERAELARAWQALETEGPVRLSTFGTLDPAVFDRLLDLFGRALAARPDASGLRSAARDGESGESARIVPFSRSTATESAVLWPSVRTSSGSPAMVREVSPNAAAQVRQLAQSIASPPWCSVCPGCRRRSRVVRAPVWRQSSSARHPMEIQDGAGTRFSQSIQRPGTSRWVLGEAVASM
ncbi:DUF2397 family protein [Streptomyces chartreusis]